jgi:hypothetical protein
MGQWCQSVSQPADDYTFFCGNRNANHHLETGFLTHQGTRLSVTRVKFIRDRMLYIIPRSCWCNIVLNVHAPRIKMMIQRLTSIRN